MKYFICLISLINLVIANEPFLFGPELDIILSHVGDYGLDLIDVRQESEEDIFYLRQRAPQGNGEAEKCKEDDCANFEAWAFEKGDDEDEKQSEIPDEIDPWDTTVARRSHRWNKRGHPKEAKICEKTKIDGKALVEGPITFNSYGYPDNNGMDRRKKTDRRVYDYEVYDQPNTAEWFKVKNIQSRIPKRSYAVEHIVEWQMLMRFLMDKTGKTNKENENTSKKTSGSGNMDEDDDDEDKEENLEATDPELCETLHKYWKQDITFDVVEESRKGRKWIPSTKVTHTKTAIQYIGHQYPGGAKSSPHSGEFVILEKNINTRKEHLWTGNSLSPRIITLADGKPSNGDKQNYKTMQFNIEHNKWWDNKQATNKEHKDATQNQGFCQAIGKFRDILGVYQYHQDTDVANIFKKQVDRTAKGFKTMEEEVLPDADIPGPNGGTRPKYVSLGLAEKWKKFMKDETDNRIAKIEEWLDKWASIFKDKIDGEDIKDLGKMFQKRAATYTNMCGTATDGEVIDRMKLLLDANKARGKWKNNLD